MEDRLEVGTIVNVIRQIGKNGKKEIVKGELLKFSNTILIEGQRTARIKYVDGSGEYYHKLDEIVND